MAVTLAEPRMYEARKAYDGKVEPSQDPALDAMAIFMPHRVLGVSADNDEVTETDASTEAFRVVEDYAIQGMPFLPFQEEEE